MAMDVEWLEEKVLLRKLDATEIELLKGLVKVAEYAPGEHIMEQGKSGGVLYMLRSGVADITCNGNGHDMRVATAREASLFGEMSF